MAHGPNAGNFSIGASASVSNVIDGGGYALAGLEFPAGVTGATWYLKEGPSSTALKPFYDSDGTKRTVTLAVDSSSATVAARVDLAPEVYHNVRDVQLAASSAQSSAVVVTPIWARYEGR